MRTATCLIYFTRNIPKVIFSIRTKAYRFGAVHKRRPHKIAKNFPSFLIRKMSALAQPPTPCEHTVWTP